MRPAVWHIRALHTTDQLAFVIRDASHRHGSLHVARQCLLLNTGKSASAKVLVPSVSFKVKAGDAGCRGSGAAACPRSVGGGRRWALHFSPDRSWPPSPMSRAFQIVLDPRTLTSRGGAGARRPSTNTAQILSATLPVDATTSSRSPRPPSSAHSAGAPKAQNPLRASLRPGASSLRQSLERPGASAPRRSPERSPVPVNPLDSARFLSLESRGHMDGSSRAQPQGPTMFGRSPAVLAANAELPSEEVPMHEQFSELMNIVAETNTAAGCVHGRVVQGGWSLVPCGFLLHLDGHGTWWPWWATVITLGQFRQLCYAVPPLVLPCSPGNVVGYCSTTVVRYCSTVVGYCCTVVGYCR